jgi:hypothetical protein
MPTKTTPPLTVNGRPNKKIDWELVDEMLRAGCLGTSIASRFDMHPNTFYDRVVKEKNVSFTDYSTQKRLEGDDELRKAQHELAKKDKNATMLIWLGKQRLNQKEQHDIVSTPNDQKLDALLADIKSMKQKMDVDSKPSPTPENRECP